MVLTLPLPVSFILAQEDVDAMPRISTPAFVCVVLAIGALWLMARVHAERRVQAHGKGPQTRLGFVRRLADWEPTHRVLGALALLFGVAAWFLR